MHPQEQLFRCRQPRRCATQWNYAVELCCGGAIAFARAAGWAARENKPAHPAPGADWCAAPEAVARQAVCRLPRHRSHSADERGRHQGEPARGKSGTDANGAPEGRITRRAMADGLVQCLENSPPGMASHAVSRVNKLSNGHGTSPSTERKALGPTGRWAVVTG